MKPMVGMTYSIFRPSRSALQRHCDARHPPIKTGVGITKGPDHGDRKPRNVTGLPDPQWSGAQEQCAWRAVSAMSRRCPQACSHVPARATSGGPEPPGAAASALVPDSAHHVATEDLEDGGCEVAS